MTRIELEILRKGAARVVGPWPDLAGCACLGMSVRCFDELTFSLGRARYALPFDDNRVTGAKSRPESRPPVRRELGRESFMRSLSYTRAGGNLIFLLRVNGAWNGVPDKRAGCHSLTALLMQAHLAFLTV